MKKALVVLAVAVTAALALNLAPRGSSPGAGARAGVDQAAVHTPPYQ